MMYVCMHAQIVMSNNLHMVVLVRLDKFRKDVV